MKLLSILFLVLTQLPIQAREYSPELAKETFLDVWNKVDATFDAETSNGVNWKSVKSTYAARVEEAKSSKELRLILNEMLDELKLSHFSVSKNNEEPDRDQERRAEAITTGYLGLELRLVDQQIMIFEIAKNSPAARAGLKPGMILTSFEGQPMAEIVEDFELTSKSTPLQRMTAITSIREKLSQPQDGQTTLETKNSDQAFEVKPGFYQGETASLGNHNNIPFFFETRLVGKEQNIRLLSFDIFLPGLMPRINQAIAQAHEEKAAGLIIDLRGNPGGVGVMASGLMGRIIDKQLNLGQMNTPSGTLPFRAFPQKGAYLGPIAALVDSFSASTSEILAAALQEHERARIFGRPTAGAALPSVLVKLPNGDHFQYALGDYVTSLHQTHLEGTGVTPDQLIPLAPPSLLAGIDPDLEAAILWLEKQSTK